MYINIAEVELLLVTHFEKKCVRQLARIKAEPVVGSATDTKSQQGSECFFIYFYAFQFVL